MDTGQIFNLWNQIERFISAYNVYLFLGLFFINLLAIFGVLHLKGKVKKIFKGDKVSLEEVLLGLKDHQEITDKSFAALQNKMKSIEEDLPKGIRRLGLVRFNPFSDAGSDQSFSLALLNDDKDGVIISSLYGREINRIYTKPIKGGKSQYQLTDEEKRAIDQAA